MHRAGLRALTTSASVLDISATNRYFWQSYSSFLDIVQDKMASKRLSSAVPIAAVEEETGLSKETLRVWERRYGFPMPLRDRRDQRLYPREQVERLLLIRRLMDRGIRPSKVVNAELRELKSAVSALTQEPLTDWSEVLETLVLLIGAADRGLLRKELNCLLMQLGLRRFVVEILAALNERVGSAWAAGRISIAGEHLYAEDVQDILRQAIGALGPAAGRPRILMTTLPGEQHQLGLLMARVCFALEDAHCTSLGVQTPLREIALAVRELQVDVVALSCSEATRFSAVHREVLDLRRLIHGDVAIWVGGRAWTASRAEIGGVTIVPELTGIPGALAHWRSAHFAQKP